MKTNCYHGRDNKGTKLFGGMLHASSYDEAAQRACHGLEVKVTTSGRVRFVNKEGKEVSLYLSVHPEHTAKGQEALKAYYEERRKEFEAAVKAGEYDDDDEESDDAKESEDS